MRSSLPERKTEPSPLHWELTVGELAARSGVAVSAIHFYETKGLVTSWRNAGNHRRYPREALRRVSIIRVAQRLGIPLASIKTALDSLPQGRTPTDQDWRRLSGSWHALLDDRIAKLIGLRDQLNGCIGCGCLSMKDCPLRNPGDELSGRGPGPHLLDPRSVEAIGLPSRARVHRTAADSR